jgi:hypothetical protein
MSIWSRLNWAGERWPSFVVDFPEGAQRPLEFLDALEGPDPEQVFRESAD